MADNNINNERIPKRRKKRKKLNIKLVAVLLLSSLLIIFGFYKLFTVAFERGRDYVNGTQNPNEIVLGEEVSFEIPEGASTTKIADILYENGLISNKLSFRTGSKLEGYDGTYKHGSYTIAKGTPEIEIMKILQIGDVGSNTIRITIPEGFTQLQIAERAENLGICTKEEFLKEANEGYFNFDFIKSLPERNYRLEGYLFPDTYFISQNGGARELINKMLGEFENVYNENISSLVAQSGFTMDEIVTMASIIESEIRFDEERPVASGVIYNRLKLDMKLQMDATVQYAQGLRKEIVTDEDLSIDSPYNTYKIQGLPLGPISNPGLSSLKAAVSPKEHNYIYYVLKDRTSGEHYFTDDYDDFIRAKAEYKSNF